MLLALVVKNGSKMRSTSSGEMPMPVSATVRPHVRARPCLGIGVDVILVECHALGLDRQRATVGHRLAGVHRHPDQGLLDLRGVGLDGVEVLALDDRQVHVLAQGALEELVEVGDDLVQVDDLGRRDLAAAEDQELAGERGAALAGLANLGQVCLQLGVAREGVGDEVRVVEDDREQVVEVVGDPAGHLADRFQPSGPLELRVDAEAPELLDAAVGDVGRDREARVHLARWRAKRRGPEPPDAFGSEVRLLVRCATHRRGWRGRGARAARTRRAT